MSKYTVQHQSVDSLLSLVRTGQVAIPELQRPFVWTSTKVRDLLDSLYKGYPVGYLITWQSMGAALKDGSFAKFQQILIDGQQRITALRAALAGLEVVDKRYRQQRIRIAFNPLTEQFETVTPVIHKNPQWIPDIAELFNSSSTYTAIKDYITRNPDVEEDQVAGTIQKLLGVRNTQIGIIALADDLDVETVSEIFIRINSKGVPLSSADFAMSKIATYGDQGRNLRKLIDYFCHLAVAPHVYEDIVKNDAPFAATPLLNAIAWLKSDSDELYDLTYGDMIRVATMVGFNRAKASSLVSLLSGRDPDTRTVDESRIPDAYNQLQEALLRVVNKHDLQQFILTIRSAGFIAPSMIGSMNALNFAYALYLRIKEDKSIPDGERKHLVRRWFVMSMLTGRHSGSFESTWDQDIRRISSLGAAAYLKQVEEAELSDGFWQVQLPANLETSSAQSPYFQAYLAAQVHSNTRGFLSKSITVSSMLPSLGDIHHIVPKDYLQKNGFADRGDYNQVANFVLTETPINIQIGNKPPTEYMATLAEQIETGVIKLGEITDDAALRENLRGNAMPADLAETTAASYPEFLAQRRLLMAELIKRYYEAL